MSPDSSYYRDLEADVSQGDIFDGIPHVHVRDPLEVVREATPKGGRRIYGLYPYPPQPGQEPDAPGRSVQGGPLDLARGEKVATFCQVSQGVLLNHDCDIENEPKHRLVVMIYPLARIADPEHRQVIERNQNYSRFYLPPDTRFGEAGYVDFRRFTSIHPDLLGRGTRRTRLSDILMGSLFRQLFLFLQHRRLTDEALFGSPEPH
jgi:hypothetical protein